jgi:hypothetical protein
VSRFQNVAWSLVVLLVACSTDNGARDPAVDGGKNDSGQSDAGDDNGLSRCDPGYASFLWPAVPVDSNLRCVDIDNPEVIRLCRNAEEGHGWTRYHCYRRIADRKEFWLNLERKNHPDPDGWERCEPENPRSDPRPPHPCFASTCPEPGAAGQAYVFSTCSERMTRTKFQCGEAESVWDANCCRRRRCVGDADCRTDEECRGVGFEGSVQYCWLLLPSNGSGYDPFDPGACACGGSLDGFPYSFCLPKP